MIINYAIHLCYLAKPRRTPQKDDDHYELLMNSLRNKIWKSSLKHDSLHDLSLKPNIISNFNNKKDIFK